MRCTWRIYSYSLGAYKSNNRIPLTIVNEKEARKYAKGMIYSLGGQSNHKEFNKRILEKHGSRKSVIKNEKVTGKLVINQQKELIFWLL